uniref:Uncharacterized protein n=1 Tax=Kalanchoe fedtschenkoi TaxID=63787 RepID=A0A7N0V3Z9_KALFE
MLEDVRQAFDIKQVRTLGSPSTIAAEFPASGESRGASQSTTCADAANRGGRSRSTNVVVRRSREEKTERAMHLVFWGPNSK